MRSLFAREISDVRDGTFYRSSARFYLPAYIFFLGSWFFPSSLLSLSSPSFTHTRATLRREQRRFLPFPLPRCSFSFSSFFFFAFVFFVFFFPFLSFPSTTCDVRGRESRRMARFARIIDTSPSTIAPFMRTFIFVRDENHPLFIMTRRVM